MKEVHYNMGKKKDQKIDLNNLYLKIEFEDNQKTQNNTIDLSINN